MNDVIANKHGWSVEKDLLFLLVFFFNIQSIGTGEHLYSNMEGRFVNNLVGLDFVYALM